MADAIFFKQPQGIRYGYRWWVCWQLQVLQQLINALLSVTVAAVSIAAYFGKVWRQYMLGKPPDKLISTNSHQLLCSVIRIVFVSKCYGVLLLVNSFYAGVADGCFVCVLRQVLHYLLWPSHGRFGIHIPVDAVKLVEELFGIHAGWW